MQERKKLIGERLFKVIKAKKISVQEFAKLVDSTVFKLYNYKKGASEMPLEVLTNLGNIGINKDYILTGEGEMFIEGYVEQKKENPLLNDLQKELMNKEIENASLKTEVKVLREFMEKLNFPKNADKQEIRSGFVKTKHSKQPSK